MDKVFEMRVLEMSKRRSAELSEQAERALVGVVLGLILLILGAIGIYYHSRFGLGLFLLGGVSLVLSMGLYAYRDWQSEQTEKKERGVSWPIRG